MKKELIDNKNKKQNQIVKLKRITMKFNGGREDNEQIAKLLKAEDTVQGDSFFDYFLSETISAERIESLGGIPYFQMTLDEKWVCVCTFKGDVYFTEPHQDIAFTGGSMLLFLLRISDKSALT